jgi:hypothetical protein
MSIKIGVLHSDLDKQIDLLKFYPEVMEKHFRALMAKDVAILYSKIKPTIPRRTGTAQRKFKKSLSGKGINMTGRVGWWGANQPWGINVVEYGAKAHVIKPRNRNGYLRLLNGQFVKSINHPGLSARGFMAAGFSAVKPMIDADMKAASEAVLKEMQVP